MKRVTLLICLLTLAVCTNLNGQIKYESRLQLDLWHKGEVTLKDGSVLAGEINFNYLLDMILVKNGEQTKAFNHKNLLEFTVFNEEENRQVNYKSLTLPIGDQIYEVVAEDDEKALLIVTIVDKKTVYYQNFSPIYGPNNTLIGTQQNPMQSRTVNRRAETFIIIDNTGHMEEIGTIVISRNNQGQLKSTIKKKQLINTLKKYSPDIEDYLEKNKVNLKKRQQLIDTFLSIMNTSKE